MVANEMQQTDEGCVTAAIAAIGLHMTSFTKNHCGSMKCFRCGTPSHFRINYSDADSNIEISVCSCAKCLTSEERRYTMWYQR